MSYSNLSLCQKILAGTTIVILAVGIYAVSARDVQCLKDYQFINERYDCGKRYVVDKKEYRGLRDRLTSFIDGELSSQKASLVSVYFRDLVGGPTLDINARVDVIPASLLKLPLVLTVLSAAEENPSVLKMKFSARDLIKTPTQSFLPGESIEDESYAVEDLVSFILTQSDNRAAQLLFNNLERITGNANALLETYRDLGIVDPGADLEKAIVNAKGYSAIFRMLFNISFLNVEFSEKVLSLLASSPFNNGLRDGVPEDIPIAHKFGERVLADGRKQLHDCGIVYYPQNPYSLCVMTVGLDFSDLSRIIMTVASEVYEEVNRRRL